MFGQWCTQRDLQLFSVGRAHIELYARWLEEQGRARASTARRLSTIVSFYRYAEEQLIAQTPAVHVRRPKLDYESGAVGLDRNEIGALLVAAGLGGTGEHALISLPASNGLRISEALGANVEDLAVERGHRALRVLRKGGKGVTIPLAPRTARAIDLAVGERVEGPIFLSVHGERLDRHAASPYGATPVPAGRDRQADRTALVAPRLHHRGLGCWGPAARRPRSRVARRPAHHHALRPGPPVPRPARDLIVAAFVAGAAR
jgi:integrase